ncbi:MAG: glycosyltransferase [Paracoccaceae bacterium]
MNAKTILIYADNIKSGGGRVLLEAVLNELRGQQLTLFLHSDTKIWHDEKWTVLYVKPKFYHRLVCNIKASRLTNERSLFFGNVPPLIKKPKSALFIQNNLLFDWRRNHKFFSGFKKLKFLSDCFILFAFRHNVDKVYVQNQDAMLGACNWFAKSKLKQLPFMPTVNQCKQTAKQFDYIFVGGFEKHKNLRNVLRAWSLCKSLGLNGLLALTITVDEFQKNCPNDLQNFSDIVFLGQLPHAVLLSEMAKAKCLIFASSVESLALPLLEASSLGVKIIASDRGFVFEVCKPNETFREDDPKSIARKIFQISGQNKHKKLDLKTPSDFVKSVFDV